MAGYKPPRVDISTYKKGVAKVRLGKNRNTGEPTGKVYVLFENEDEPIKVSREDCPKYIQEGEFFVTMEKNNEGIQSMTPLNGSVMVRFFDFIYKEGSTPEPKTITNPKYNSQETVFDQFLKITQGKYKGMPIFMRLPYWFRPVKEGDKEVVGIEYHPKSPHP